jgi:proteasome lid subunit RPN8/RPN11
MNEKIENKIREHAEKLYPQESCGFLLIVNGREVYYECVNEAADPINDFHISHEQFAKAEDLGEMIAVVHSHPNMHAKPSQADMVMCELLGLEWHIVSVLQDDVTKKPVSKEIKSFKPSGYVAPYVGRVFSYGVLDCHTLMYDYYLREFGIKLIRPESKNHWWDNGQDLYLENFEAGGFCEVKDGKLQKGDVIFMQLRAKKTNHVAVYIGDGLMLHHVSGRLSSRDVYDGYWQEITRRIGRHKDVRNGQRIKND